MPTVYRYPTNYTNLNGSSGFIDRTYALDESYASFTSGFPNFSCYFGGFSAVSLPAGAVVNSVKIGIRYYFESSQSTADVTMVDTSSSSTQNGTYVYLGNSTNYSSSAITKTFTVNRAYTDISSLYAYLYVGGTTTFRVDAIWYEVNYSMPPTVPPSISYPTSCQGGDTITLNCGASSDPDGNLSGYSWEIQYDGGSWTSLGTSATTSKSVTIPAGKNTALPRVRAYDASGLYSDYRTGASTISVINNVAPAISGSDSSLGTKTAAFTQTYTVTDAEGNSVSVTEKIDGITLRTYTATLGATNTFSITGNTWLTMPNGSHTLTVTASDGQASTTRTWTFTKSVTTVQFALSSPLAADAMPTKCICNIQGSFPLGSTLTFEVCNNGNDASPTWENITTKVLNGQKHFFTNTIKTAANWGFNIRVTLLRGTATGTCAIQSVGGNFE